MKTKTIYLCENDFVKFLNLSTSMGCVPVVDERFTNKGYDSMILMVSNLHGVSRLRLVPNGARRRAKKLHLIGLMHCKGE